MSAALAEIKRRRDVEVFLQGSYANSTNIRADSDVDVVVMTRRTYRGAFSRLGPETKALYDALPTATFTHRDLRAEVKQALVDYYGSTRVSEKNKCIRVEANGTILDIDVVPCIQYKHYKFSDALSDFVEGVAIYPLDGGMIVNFPKEHIKNGQAKNGRCGLRYKATVRQMKRLRNRAVDQGYLQDGIAPGYLLECMVYNAPDSKFVSDDSDRLSGVLLWLKHADKAGFMSCDGIHTLFGTDPGGFSRVTAQTILDALWEAY